MRMYPLRIGVPLELAHAYAPYAHAPHVPPGQMSLGAIGPGPCTCSPRACTPCTTTLDEPLTVSLELAYAHVPMHYQTRPDLAEPALAEEIGRNERLALGGCWRRQGWGWRGRFALG